MGHWEIGRDETTATERNHDFGRGQRRYHGYDRRRRTASFIGFVEDSVGECERIECERFVRDRGEL